MKYFVQGRLTCDVQEFSFSVLKSDNQLSGFFKFLFNSNLELTAMSHWDGWYFAFRVEK